MMRQHKKYIYDSAREAKIPIPASESILSREIIQDLDNMTENARCFMDITRIYYRSRFQVENEQKFVQNSKNLLRPDFHSFESSRKKEWPCLELSRNRSSFQCDGTKPYTTTMLNRCRGTSGELLGCNGLVRFRC